MLGLIKQNFY